MSYGSGSGWGSGDPWGSGSEFTQRMVARLLMFVQHGPRFVALVNALATRTGDLRDAASTIVAAFDIDTAAGTQLDRLGAILQRPRFGMTDDRYRTLLHIQIDLILSSTASAETLLSVVERLTGFPAPEYSEHYPAGFTIGAIVDPDDVVLLLDLLRKAKGWGINGRLVEYPAADILFVDTTTEDVADPGVVDALPASGGPDADAFVLVALHGV